jgi:hypothetical protein
MKCFFNGTLTIHGPQIFWVFTFPYHSEIHLVANYFTLALPSFGTFPHGITENPLHWQFAYLKNRTETEIQKITYDG